MTIDRIDMEEITDRIEELRASRDEYNEKMDDENAWAGIDDGEPEELAELEELIEELRGAGGGDHQWEGDWYPRELIAESDFEEYAEELAEDCGMVNSDAGWPNNCIDWQKAARELAQDYSLVTFRGADYYWR